MLCKAAGGLFEDEEYIELRKKLPLLASCFIIEKGF